MRRSTSSSGCNHLHFSYFASVSIVYLQITKLNLTFEVLTALFLNIQVFLVNKTKRRTEFQLYWYYDSTCFGQPFCPSSGVLSRTLALVHFMQLRWPFATRNSSILFLVANGHRNCIKCTNADVRQRTPDDGQKACPETCRVVIPINLEFSASVDFIHKEFVTMHGHTILKVFRYVTPFRLVSS